MEIREYGPFRLEELLSLYGSVGWTAYTERPETLEAAVRRSLCVLGAYGPDGALAGLVRAVGDGASVLLAQDLLVRPEAQRQGVGTALMRALLARYPAVRQVLLLTDRTEKTLAFYRSLGLRPAGEQGCEAFLLIR